MQESKQPAGTSCLLRQNLIANVTRRKVPVRDKRAPSPGHLKGFSKPPGVMGSSDPNSTNFGSPWAELHMG